MLVLLDDNAIVVIKYTEPPVVVSYTKQEYRELIERMDEELVAYHYNQQVDEASFRPSDRNATLQARVIQKTTTPSRIIEYGSTYTFTLAKYSGDIRIKRIEMAHDQEPIQDSKSR